MATLMNRQPQDMNDHEHTGHTSGVTVQPKTALIHLYTRSACDCTAKHCMYPLGHCLIVTVLQSCSIVQSSCWRLAHISLGLERCALFQLVDQLLDQFVATEGDTRMQQHDSCLYYSCYSNIIQLYGMTLPEFDSGIWLTIDTGVQDSCKTFVTCAGQVQGSTCQTSRPG